MNDNETTTRQIIALNVSELQVDESQPRQYFDEEKIEELADSIDKHSLLEPILFRKVFDDENQKENLFVVAGERRLRAVKLLGLETIEGIEVEGDDQKIAEIALIDNLKREGLSAIEEAEALQKLKSKHEYNDERLGQLLGKGRSTITEILSINKLPKDVRDECLKDPSVPKRALITIAKEEDERAMRKLYSSFKKRGLTSDELKKITRPRKETFRRITGYLDGFDKKMGLIRDSSLSPEERKQISDRLNAIKTQIETSLAMLAASTTEESTGD